MCMYDRVLFGATLVIYLLNVLNITFSCTIVYHINNYSYC